MAARELGLAETEIKWNQNEYLEGHQKEGSK